MLFNRLISVLARRGVVLPTTGLDFLASDSLPGGVTFSRASSATRINGSGLVEAVSAGVARIGYSLAGQRFGLMLEPAATNKVLYSRDLTNTSWAKALCTAAACAGADGVAGTATTLTCTGTNGFTRQVLSTGSSNRVLKFLARRRTGGAAISCLQTLNDTNLVSNGTFDTDITSGGWVDASTAPSSVTWSSGSALFNIVSAQLARFRFPFSVVAGGIYEVSATGTCGNLNIGLTAGASDILGTGVAAQTRIFRASTTGTIWLNTYSSVNGQTLDNVRIREMQETVLTLTSSWNEFVTPATTATDHVVGFRISTSTNEIDVDFVQSEIAPGTSYIPTTSATVDRVADTATITLPSNSDVLIQDRYGAEWRNGISAGTYTITPRSGQTTVARLLAYPAGALSSTEKTALAVAA